MDDNNLTDEQLKEEKLIAEYKKYEYEKYKHLRKDLERIKQRRRKEYGYDKDWSLT